MTPQRTRTAAWLIAAVAVGIAGVAITVVLRNGDPAPRLAGDAPTAPAAATATRPATPNPTPTATATSTPSPDPSPSPTPSPQAGVPLTDLDTLVPQRVAGFRQVTDRRATQRLQQPGATEARRLHYRNAAGADVTHVVTLHRGNAAAGQALRERRGQLLDRRGARVTDDTGLEDDDGVRRGRLIEVRRRNGEVVVLWRNRNLVAELGPGRVRLLRRLYDRWPY